MKIGLMGCIVSSGNMGCEALALSTLTLLEKCSVNSGNNEYVIFDSGCDDNQLSRISRLTGVERSRLDSSSFCNFERFRGIRSRVRFMRGVAACDVVIDMTSGDSFTDIYGSERFLSGTSMKEYVLRKRIPLILGPQTYGPFNNKEYGRRAIEVIKRASLVISRDPLSSNFLSGEGVTGVVTTTDLAFELVPSVPATKDSRVAGLNVSGLLWGVEGSDDGVCLACNYKLLMSEVASCLLKRGYKVKLIGHVKNDLIAADELLAIVGGGLEIVEFGSDPIAIKGQIGQCGLFIGSRMHATIAAISQGIPTIPLAYSRKFAGLFSSVGYLVNIDLQTMDTASASNEIARLLDNIDKLSMEATKAARNANSLCEETRSLLTKALNSVSLISEGDCLNE